MENKRVIIKHLLDVIDKVERDWKWANVGFYDDYDGTDDDGEDSDRNTPALLVSLKALYESIRDDVV